MTDSRGPDGQPRTPWYRHPAVRSLAPQVVLVVVVAWSALTLYTNTVENLAKRGIKTGTGFMDEVAPFSIPLNFTPMWEFVLGESVYWDVFIIGIQNTLVVALLGIPSATLLGTVIGVLLLSPNWLVRKLAAAYVEVFRNTPLLLQLLFWGFAIFPVLFNSLPPVNESILAGGAVFNSSGVYLPALVMDTAGTLGLLGTLAAFGALLWLLLRYARKRRDETGKPFPTLLCSLAIAALVFTAFLLLAGEHLSFELPVKKGLNYRGGMRPPKELLVLWFGLTIYTSTFIAENVRGGILSVSPGQSEAGMALGLSRIRRMRLIILPQSLRVIIPPTISQFLNLTKNSSLAVAVGYPEITNIWMGIALNQTGQALIIIGMTILVYELFSLVTSALSNWYNASVQIRER